VGREAGVSMMAASAALNWGRSSVHISAETRERVLAAAERLRYRPNATARALAHQRTNAIGFVTPFLGQEPNLYFLEIFSGFVRAAAAARQTIVVFTLADWAEGPQRIPTFCDGRVDGLILLAPRLPNAPTPWLPEHTPLVSVHAQRPLAGVVNLQCDDEAGAFEMVSHLLALGHRRILHIAGRADLAGAESRVQGYRRAHAAAGVKPAPGHLVRAPFTVEGGREAMQRWLDGHQGKPLPDVVFAGNDGIAHGCMDVLQTHGLRVPADISVVGFDDILLARASRMATVHQPLDELGVRAVDVLMQHIEARRGGQAYQGPMEIVLPTGMVFGATLGPPRGGRLLVA
jgi:DNA-binding LacI/PurR family transcriptional regulator